jgi:hypothetical protein
MFNKGGSRKGMRKRTGVSICECDISLFDLCARCPAGDLSRPAIRPTALQAVKMAVCERMPATCCPVAYQSADAKVVTIAAIAMPTVAIRAARNDALNFCACAADSGDEEQEGSAVVQKKKTVGPVGPLGATTVSKVRS